jgi:transcriptional regulator with XRE-family HTH domain
MTSNKFNFRRMQGTGFGPLLKQWRQRRGLSQLSLAVGCGVSQRHVSFLETGRAMPSREIIVRIGTELSVPLRHRNELFLAAGFAPLYSETNWEASDLAPVRRAVELILARQEPYPAIVLDGLWNIQLANAGATALFKVLSASGRPVDNIMKAVFDARNLRSAIENWESLAAHLRVRLRQHAELHGTSKDFGALVDEVNKLDPSNSGSSSVALTDPLLWISVRRNRFRARLFSTITTLGTAYDIGLQELSIECFFPADDASARELAALTLDKAANR